MCLRRARGVSPLTRTELWARLRPRRPSVADVARGSGAPLADLLDEVAAFRLALETDLTIAAAAAEADADDVAAGLLADEDAALARFQARAQAHLRELPAQRGRTTRLGRRVAGGLAVGAVAIGSGMSGFALAGLARHGVGRPAGQEQVSAHATSVELGTAKSELLALTSEVRDNPAAVNTTAATLQATITMLVAGARRDPSTAGAVTTILLAEERLLGELGSPAAVTGITAAHALLQDLAEGASPEVARVIAEVAAGAAVPAPSGPTPAPSLHLVPSAPIVLPTVPTSHPSTTPLAGGSVSPAPPASTPPASTAPTKTQPTPSTSPAPTPSLLRSSSGGGL